MALAAAIPLAVVVVVAVSLTRSEREERAFERLGLTVDAGLAQLAQVRGELEASAARAAASRSLLDLVVADPAPREAPESIRLAEGVDAVVVVGPDGAPVASAVAAPAAAGAAALDVGALAKGRPGPWLVARADIVEAGAGVRGSVIVAERVDASQVGAMARPAGSSLDVVTQAAPEGRSTQGSDGSRRFVVRRAVPGTTASLVASVRADAVASSRRGLVFGGAALLLAMLAATVAIGWVVGGVITRGVQDVARAARDVASGDYGRQVEASGDEEIVELATAFNVMTDHLREAMDALARRQEGFNAALTRLGDALAGSHDLSRILEVVVEASVDSLRADAAAFFSLESPPARLTATAVNGAALSHGMVLDGRGLAGTSARLGRAVVWPPPSGDEAGAPRPELPEPAVSTGVAVPVSVRGRPYGVVAVYGRPRPFHLSDVETLQTLARQAEVAIDNIALHEEAQRHAVTDGLTGLWNRRQFDLRIRDEMQRAERFGDSFSIVLVDVDHFKAVNDRHGHSTGDAALVFIAERLREAVREIDVVARWGGEEFAVLLPRTDVEDAALVAERIRSFVSAAPMATDGEELSLSISAGVAAHAGPGQSVVALFREADGALYRAKAHGRNRVERADSPGRSGGDQ